jgi:hypothetical protein
MERFAQSSKRPSVRPIRFPCRAQADHSELRDLEDSAPYFHNGSAPKFNDLVNRYIRMSQLAHAGRDAQCSTRVRKHVTEPGRPGNVGCVSAVADRGLRRLDLSEAMHWVFRVNLSWLTLIAALRIIEAAPIQFGGVAQMVRATDS